MKTQYHYTYRITNILNFKTYIGVRTSTCPPAEDTAYWSSSQTLKDEINAMGQQYFVKEIISTWPTRADAMAHEVELHSYYDVGRNPNYYNKVKQTATGFSNQGLKFKRTEEQKRRYVIANRLKAQDPAFCAKLSANSKGKNLGIKRDKATVEQQKASRLGNVWWNDGVNERLTKTAPTPAWKRGRLPSPLKKAY